jgi:hypothetical protein
VLSELPCSVDCLSFSIRPPIGVVIDLNTCGHDRRDVEK